MAASASIIVPTRGRPAYLAVALASIAPQAAAAGADVLVVDDSGRAAGGALAARYGAAHVAHDAPRGLNAARNTGLDATAGELVVFVDDDIEAQPGWLDALLRAARELPDVDVFTGPIRARLEDHQLRCCGREGPPLTFLDEGPDDRDVRYAWGANMAIRRSAFARLGRFDPARELYGDEQEWQDRLHAAGGRVRYVVAAAVDHRRAGDDARLRSLARAAFARGGASRRFDAYRDRAPSLAAELCTLAGCVGHVVRYRCANGIVLAAHSAGRIAAALARGARARPAPTDAPAAETAFAATKNGAVPAPGGAGEATDDFLSGASGTVGGLDGARRALRDAALDVRALASGRARRLGRDARAQPPRRVLVLAVERPELHSTLAATLAELGRSRHRLELGVATAGTLGKFENLNALLAEHVAADHDWLLVIDDDVALPRGFLDRFLFLAERFELRLAQPAQRLSSHAAWEVTRRRARSVVRETAFVEIGPLTAFQRDTFASLLPFPALRMGWGLDLHWAALARQHGWRIGVVDAVPVGHSLRPAGATYPRAEAIAEAQAFLAGRPYLHAAEAQRTLAVHRRWE